MQRAVAKLRPNKFIAREFEAYFKIENKQTNNTENGKLFHNCKSLNTHYTPNTIIEYSNNYVCIILNIVISIRK